MTDLPQKTLGIPMKRYHDLYYGHVYLDRKLYNTVRLFAEWENSSLKAATYQLIIFGLHFYCVTQLRLEQARQTKQTPERTHIYSLDDIGNLLARMHKAKKACA